MFEWRRKCSTDKFENWFIKIFKTRSSSRNSNLQVKKQLCQIVEEFKTDLLKLSSKFNIKDKEARQYMEVIDITKKVPILKTRKYAIKR